MWYKVRREMHMEISIVIVNYYTESVLDHCLTSLVENDKPESLKVIIINNGSSPGSLEKLVKKFEQRLKLTILTNRSNVGFARAVNQGLRQANGNYIFLLNPDTTLITFNGIQRLKEVLEKHADIGIVAPKIIYPDGTTQSEGEWTPSLVSLLGSQLLGLRSQWWRRLQYKRNCSSALRFVDWVTGAAMMIRHDLIEKIGGFNEEYWLYGEDVEFCHRARKHGYRIAVLPTVVVVHDKGKAVEHHIAQAYINSALGMYRFQREIHGEFYARTCVLVLFLGVLIRAVLAPLRRKPFREYIRAGLKIWCLFLRGLRGVKGDIL